MFARKGVLPALQYNAVHLYGRFYFLGGVQSTANTQTAVLYDGTMSII